MPRRILPVRIRRQLNDLESALGEARAARGFALGVFRASVASANASAQREYWLEFSWLDQEYRVAVRKLAVYCARRTLEQADHTVRPLDRFR